jgi:hypothetical protein
MSNLALLLQERGAAGDGLPLLQQARAGFRKELSPEHWMVGVALTNLGRCEAALCYFAEAEESLLQAHAVLEKALGPSHGRTLLARRALAELYDAWERPAEAEAWRDEHSRP